MSSFVELAILLKKAHALTIVDSRFDEDEPYTEQDIIVSINNQQYLVSNVGSDSDHSEAEEKQSLLIDERSKYSKAFLNSINSKELPCINKEQNGEILFNAAYRALRYLPAYCGEPSESVEDEKVSSLLMKEIFSLCGDWKSSLNIKLNPKRNESEDFEEFFDCAAAYRNDAGLGSVRFAFRYQRPQESETMNKEFLTEPIAVAVGDQGSFRDWLNGHTLAGTPAGEENLKTKALDGVKERLNELLNLEIVTNDYLSTLPEDRALFNVDSVKVNSLKYRRIRTYKASMESPVTGNTSSLAVGRNFDPSALFVYEPRVIPTLAPINVFKCPTPSCTKYATMDRTEKMELYVDPNWRKPYAPVTGIYADDIEKWFRHAVGCKVCMSESCSFCGQRYYPYQKLKELKSFYGYAASPKKAFLFESNQTRDAGVLARLKSGVDTVADYCGCMQNIYWFYDEAFRIDTGDEARTDRVLRNRDMVFINKLTKEVVAAYSPASYAEALKAVKQLFLTDENGQQESEEFTERMTAGQIQVFFSDYVEKKIGRSSELGKFRAFLNVEKGETFMDKLDAKHLNAYCASLNMSDEEKGAFLDAVKEELDDLLEKFRKKLSKLSSIDGRDGHIMYTSVYSCSLCKVCGSLYFVKDAPNAAVMPLSGKHGADDVCTPESKGRWMTIRGGIFYKDRKNGSTHISSRYVLTSKKEVSFANWQKGIAENILKN